MSIEEFIIWIYCWVDEHYQSLTRPPPSGEGVFPPKLSDSEVLTMELVGEFLQLDTDVGIWRYFTQHWSGHFPKLGSRSQFAKQAANLWVMKHRLQTALADELGAKEDTVHLIDGFPIPLCGVRRASSCRVFKGIADYGYCAAKSQMYYGLRGHMLVSMNGTISGLTVTPASDSERQASFDLLDGVNGLLLGDKGYLGEAYCEELAQQGIELQTPLRANMKETRPRQWVKTMMKTRRLIETVIGQWSQRFTIEKVWARDVWHLMNRMYRKILSHTLAVTINRSFERDPLKFDAIITA